VSTNRDVYNRMYPGLTYSPFAIQSTRLVKGRNEYHDRASSTYLVGIKSADSIPCSSYTAYRDKREWGLCDETDKYNWGVGGCSDKTARTGYECQQKAEPKSGRPALGARMHRSRKSFI
jgi:hypothetical protein